MKGDEMELVAQLLLKSRIVAYLEWLDNKLIMAPNNNINKDSLWSASDFREGKSTESMCNKTVVDHIIQILVKYHIHTTIISEYK